MFTEKANKSRHTLIQSEDVPVVQNKHSLLNVICRGVRGLEH